MAKGKTGGRRARGGGAGGSTDNTKDLGSKLDQDAVVPLPGGGKLPVDIVLPGGKKGRVKPGRAFREMASLGVALTGEGASNIRNAFRNSVTARVSNLVIDGKTFAGVSSSNFRRFAESAASTIRSNNPGLRVEVGSVTNRSGASGLGLKIDGRSVRLADYTNKKKK